MNRISHFARPALVILASAITGGLLQAGTKFSPEAAMLYPKVSGLISAEGFAGMSPAHQRMLANLAIHGTGGTGTPALCFSGPMPWEQAQAFNMAIQGGRSNPGFQQTARWSFTATNGSATGQGTPITLTYSFVPDGTSIPSGIGEPASNSTLFATFDANFASRAQWQNLFHQMFARWGELCGVTYVFEPNDDGAQLLSLDGQLGVRGDLRIGAHPIDGGSGSNTLAYNFFPNSGDMVIDTDNIAFFANPAGNFLAFRNVLAHEHGHGMGQLHVCPLSQTKLMEPIVSVAYDGPQIDDIQNAQRHYGDRFENNDTALAATDLTPSIIEGMELAVDAVSIDDNSDVDFYKVTHQAGRRLSVTISPAGETYLQGPQTANCDVGSPYNSLTVHDLSLQLIGSDGSTVLATSSGSPAGQSESIQLFNLPDFVGSVFVRVAGGTTDSIQLYKLQLILAPVAAPTQTPTPTLSPTPSPTPTPADCPLGAFPDPSFEAEAGAGGPWVVGSTNFGSPVCTAALCGGGATALSRSGSAWAWFGGATSGVSPEVGFVQQSVQIPSGVRPLLEFHLFTGQSSGNAGDFIRLLIDGQQLFISLATDTGFRSGYVQVQIDLTPFADNQNHLIRFESSTITNSPPTNFNLDDVTLRICPVETPSPTPSPSPTPTASPTMTPFNGRALGDFDNSGCTDLADFLFLLDNWQLDFNGTVVGLDDFLALLDNWQSGPAC